VGGGEKKKKKKKTGTGVWGKAVKTLKGGRKKKKKNKKKLHGDPKNNTKGKKWT